MRTTFLLLLAVILGQSALRAEDNWPQFRGPRGTGQADATGLPIRWSETENLRWKTPIHDKGWSSPVVWGGQVWLTTARGDGKEMFALGLDRASGKVLHDVKVFDVEKPAFCHPFNSYASPTPVIEEGRVYVHFGTYGTACLDTAGGKVLWSRRDFPCDHFRGPGSSPILYGNLLIVHYDGVDLQYVVALDKATGKTVWKKDRDIDYHTTNPDLKKAYATPAVLDIDGQPQLIGPSASATIAYAPLTGEELWRVNHGGMNVASPPLLGHGKLFLCTGDGGFKLFALRPEGKGDLTSQVEWKCNKAVPSRCSPLLIGDSLYFVNEGGTFSCLEAKTGQLVWQDRVPGDFSASLVCADGKIYCASQGGTTYVIEPGKSFKLLAANKLNDGCMASPAVAGNALFLRTKTHLYCIQGK